MVPDFRCIIGLSQVCYDPGMGAKVQVLVYGPKVDNVLERRASG